MTQAAIVTVAVAIASALLTFVAGYAVVRERLETLRRAIDKHERRLRRAERWIDVETGAKQAAVGPAREPSDVVALRTWDDSGPD